MADTPLIANPGEGGASLAADLDGNSVSWPYAKVAFGQSGTQTEVSTASPLPVTSSSDGTAGTGLTPPTGGSGILGFLSGIYSSLINSLRFLDGQVTPHAATVSQITTGGTAVTVITGPINGGFITNPINAAAQGVTAENLYVDMVASPGSTDSTANGTTALLLPGGSLPIPALATGATLKANAATSLHKFTVVVW